MSGRRTQAQIIIDLIDKRIKTVLGVSGISFKSIPPGSANAKSESSKAFEDVSFITRDDHRGMGHGDLPNSRPAFDLDCELIPDIDNKRSIGLSDRAWNTIFTHRLYLKGVGGWLKLSVDYFHRNIAFKTRSIKAVIYGYGNHRALDQSGKVLYPNEITLTIRRPMPYLKAKPYTGIKSWSFDPWYSDTDIDNATGIGSRYPCVSTASPLNPGVTAQLLDTGNPEYVYVKFRNYLPYPIVVGASIKY